MQHVWARTGVYRILVGKLEGKGPLGKRSWEGNMKMDHQEVGIWETWTGLIWLRIGAGGGNS